MEILRHGSTFKKTTCPKCNCLFSFSEKDIFWMNEFDFCGHVKCPECDNIINGRNKGDENK